MSDRKSDMLGSSDIPNGDLVTSYDRQHMATYLSLLHAAGEGVSIEDMAREILDLDPNLDPSVRRDIVQDHLARARWLATSGYKHLLTEEPISNA